VWKTVGNDLSLRFCFWGSFLPFCFFGFVFLFLLSLLVCKRDWGGVGKRDQKGGEANKGKEGKGL